MDIERKNAIIEIDYEEIGKRIKHRRKSLGITQNELAQMVGVTSYHISHVENANALPSLELIINISFRLNTTPDYLILGARRTTNATLAIIETLKLCSEDDLKIISDIISAFVKNRKDG